MSDQAPNGNIVITQIARVRDRFSFSTTFNFKRVASWITLREFENMMRLFDDFYLLSFILREIVGSDKKKVRPWFRQYETLNRTGPQA